MPSSIPPFSPDLANVTDPAAREQLFLLLLGQLRDGMAATNDNLKQLNKKTDDIHTRVVQLESSDSSDDFNELRQECRDSKARIHTVELQMARYQGLFMPMAVLGSALLTGLGTLLIQRLFGA